MADKLLYENLLNEEQGFDGQTSGTIGTTVSSNAEGSTSTTDIAQTAPKIGFAHSVASKTLPAVLGYVQPMSSPSGFVFAMKRGPAVNQTTDMPFLDDGTGTPESGTAGSEDLQITRTSVNTSIREVLIDCTNELTQDIQSLFGQDFNKLMQVYLYYDGTDIDMIDPFETNTLDDKESTDLRLSKFFIEYATWRMSRKTNQDFVTWAQGIASDLGTVTITDTANLKDLRLAVAEMKASVYKNTGKTGRTWVLASPENINYLLMTSSTCSPDNKVMRKGKRIARSEDYNYVFSCGETDYYQDSNITDDMYVGLSGQAGVSSLFYTPYKEYFVQGGEDYYTGQSNIWFRLRDDWVTNPLDNFGGVNDLGTPVVGTGSDYIVKAIVDITAVPVLS